MKQKIFMLLPLLVIVLSVIFGMYRTWDYVHHQAQVVPAAK